MAQEVRLAVQCVLSVLWMKASLMVDHRLTHCSCEALLVAYLQLCDFFSLPRCWWMKFDNNNNLLHEYENMKMSIWMSG